MGESEIQRYLVILSVGNPTQDHLKYMVPNLLTALQGLSDESPEQAFRSVNADYFGYLIRSKRNAHQIRAALESPGGRSGKVDPFLSGDDNLFIIEVGEDFSAGKGFTRVGTWLQRH